MIKKLIARIFTRRKPEAPRAVPPTPVRHAPVNREPVRYSGSEQGVHREDVSSAAIRTCETLQRAGHKAFIVGGGVRDLLLGLKPKDFDVATDATPDEVTKLIRRSRVIGRRFQIVHAMYGREVIEVSTFRALQADAETDEHGRVLRDNAWGSQAEDAARRDFTINALYYDPVADVILDYHDGVRDLHRRTIRMIGDPALRYREDPVRMLRSARFAAKTGFGIEEATRRPIRELAPLINNVPPARLFDEMLKLLQTGHSLESLQQLRNEGLHHGLLPLLDVALEQPDGERFIRIALTRTDERVLAGKSVSPGFLFATLLWQQVRVRWNARVADGEPSIPALHAAIDSVVDEQSEKLAIQKRIIADMREIWSLQPRFDRRSGNAPHRLLAHLRFRAGYDFMILRCDAGEAPAELGSWWTRFAEADMPEREDLLSQAPRGEGPKKRRRRKPVGRKAGSDAAPGSGD
ncbi:MAG: putative polynucleotide adenylyltransferase protein [Pseudomonadota bacterium]|jgi:poly(A) polymerase